MQTTPNEQNDHRIKMNPFDINQTRLDFIQLDSKVTNKKLIYFDNAATTLKPKVVVDVLSKYYQEQSSNVHRGIHYYSELGTRMYEEARETVKVFLNAKDIKEIIYTKGTTEGINLVSSCLLPLFDKDDEIIISHMEHHSNIVPWQILCEKTGAKLKVIKVNDQGELDLDDYKKLLNSKTKLVAVTHVSNTLGTINDVKLITSLAKQHGAMTLIDGAQAVAHVKVDVQDIDCDFYVFSAHKLFGPTGIGILYGKEDVLEKLPPYQSGGSMISKVTLEKTTYNELPFKFEAGTPHIAGTIGMKTAIEYYLSKDHQTLLDHENELLEYATQKMKEIKDLWIMGTAKNKTSVISFDIDGVHPLDLATLLDQQSVAIRTGHHCTTPLLERFNKETVCRASFSIYNTKEEVDIFINALRKSIDMLK